MVDAVDEAVVDLVGDDEEVVPVDDLGDGGHHLAAHHGAGGVRRVADEERLGAGRDALLQVIGVEGEAVLGTRRHLRVRATGEENTREIGDVARIGAQHLVALIDDGGERDVQRFADAGGRDDLGAGVVVDAVQALQVARDGGAQLDEAIVGRVVGLAILDALDGGLANLVRGDEVRLAHAERDHALHAREEVKEAPDAGGGDGLDVLGDVAAVGYAV